MKLIERHYYLDKLKNVMNTPDIKIITGIRRSGKSKLLESFIHYIKGYDKTGNIIHINYNLLLSLPAEPLELMFSPFLLQNI